MKTETETEIKPEIETEIRMKNIGGDRDRGINIDIVQVYCSYLTAASSCLAMASFSSSLYYVTGARIQSNAVHKSHPLTY